MPSSMTQQRYALESTPKAFFIHDVHLRTKRDFILWATLLQREIDVAFGQRIPIA